MVIGPQYILDKNHNLVRVYIGIPHRAHEQPDTVGIFVKTEDYEKIDHTKIYTFIHKTEDEDIDEESLNFLIKNGHLNEKVDDPMSVGRVHMHLGVEWEFEEDESYENEKIIQ